MSDKSKGSPFIYNEYIETKNGLIHIDDVPRVTTESFKSRIGKAILFYSVFIVALVIIIYLMYAYEYHRRAVQTIKTSHLISSMIQPTRVPDIAQTRLIKIYNHNYAIPLSNIILVDIYDNVFDIDTKRNYFISHKKIGEENKGDLFEIDFGKEILVKEIILMVDADKVILQPSTGSGVAINMEIFDINYKRVWSYSSILSQKETTIQIFKEVYQTNSSTRKYSFARLVNTDETEKVIFSENELAIKLKEDSEEYMSYEY